MTPAVAETSPAVPDFFQTLFGNVDDSQFLEVVTNAPPAPTMPSQWAPLDHPVNWDAIVDHINARRQNAWFGALPRIRQREKGQGGRNEDVETFSVLFADLDGKDVDAKDPDCGIAWLRERLAHLALPPTAMVATGGGYHAYWRLATPYPIAEDWRSAERAMYLALLSDKIGVSNAIKAFQSAGDPRRILRVPGTRNWKARYGSEGRPVVLEQLTQTRYPFSEMARALERWTKIGNPAARQGQADPEWHGVWDNPPAYGSWNDTITRLYGHYAGRGLLPVEIQALIRTWWDNHLTPAHHPTTEQRQDMERQLDGLIRRYPSRTVADIDAADLSNDDIAALTATYPGLLARRPEADMRAALRDGVAAEALAAVLRTSPHDSPRIRQQLAQLATQK